MPNQPAAPRDVLARVMVEGKKTLVPLLGEMLRRKGIEEVDGGEMRRRYWQAALTDEQEQQMWTQEMIARGITQLVPGDPQTLDIGLKISKAKYPDRWDMLGQEGRDQSSAQAEWAWKQAQKGPPAPKTDEGEGY